jgi:hypothetical protein
MIFGKGNGVFRLQQSHIAKFAEMPGVLVDTVDYSKLIIHKKQRNHD